MEMQDRLANNVGSLPGGKPAGKTDIPTTEDQDRVKAARKVIEALTLQRDALGKTNLQKQIALELSKAQTTADTEQGQKIVELVTGLSDYETAVRIAATRMDEFRQRQEALQQGFDFMGDAASDALSAIFTGAQGASRSLKQMAIDLGLAAAKALLLGQGPLAGMFQPIRAYAISPTVSALAASGAGGLFAKGGVANRPSIFAEAGPEAAVPLPDGRRIPVDLRGAEGLGGGGGNSINYAPTIHAPGATAETVEALKRVIEEDRRNFAKNVAAVYSDGRSRRAPGFRG